MPTAPNATPIEPPLSLPGSRRRSPRVRAVPEGIRITKVGLWYVLLTVIVAISATNTGNNALYMVLAVMLGSLVTSGLLSRQNVRGLDIAVESPGEVYANQPFFVRFELASRGRLLPRWLLLLSLARHGRPLLVPHLPRRGSSRGELEALISRRGLHRLRGVLVTSLFPFGFFRKGVRYRADLEVLVYPELFAAASSRFEGHGEHGEQSMPRAGRGYDLHTLRVFRPGDDPRSIHWKQTARTGQKIFMEREAEKSRRLAILFDNGVGRLEDEETRQRFERLVSEAATAAVDHLGRGFEVELVTRERRIPFAAGLRQRYAILEILALVSPCPREGAPLISQDPRCPALRLGLESGGAGWEPREDVA